MPHSAKKRKIILIDLDHTLVDTEKMRQDRFAILRKFGVTEGESDRAMERRARSGNVIINPMWSLSLIPSRSERARAAAMVRAVYAPARKYNYEGIEEFLSRLNRRYDLVLFSYGHRPFQILKFEQSALGRFFKKTVITTNLHKRKDLLALKKKYGDDILLIDDSVSVAQAAGGAGVKVIRVRKGLKGAAYYRALAARIEKRH